MMDVATWSIDVSRPVVATAIHHGHELRPEVEALIALDEPTRLREEDPHTGDMAADVGSHVTVNRSRFEVDLNRNREGSVYITPEQAWGLQVWRVEPDPGLAEESRQLHDDFYRRLTGVLDDLADRHGGFVLFDVHSYNHRRRGPESPPEPREANPSVNLGTGSLPLRWNPVADRFISSISDALVGGEPLDVRTNVRFEGGHLASWVNERYGQVGCGLAIEFKKEFMDEWTNELDRVALSELGEALAGTVDDVWEAYRTCR